MPNLDYTYVIDPYYTSAQRLEINFDTMCNNIYSIIFKFNVQKGSHDLKTHLQD